MLARLAARTRTHLGEVLRLDNLVPALPRHLRRAHHGAPSLLREVLLADTLAAAAAHATRGRAHDDWTRARALQKGREEEIEWTV